MPAGRLDEEDDHEQVPGECELKSLTVERSEPIVVATEDFSVDFSSWSIGNSESFDEGEVCGKVDNRSTSVASFEQALERRDGNGFGNPILSRVSYQGAGGVVDTQITSSTVTTVSVTSNSGAPNDPTLDTVGYGRTFYTSLVMFRDSNGGSAVLPLLFHDPVGCLGENIDLDVYGSAVLGYANFLGGNVTSVPATTDSFDSLVILERDNVILLSPEALNDYVVTQVKCDLATEPVWTEAGYAMCSELPQYAIDGVVILQAVPNVTTVVNDCPVSVLPARFMAVGDFINGTFDSRFSQWGEDMRRVQARIVSDVVDAVATAYTAASPVIQSSTQIGFAIPDANDSTEWVLVLAVAIESLLVVLAALVPVAFAVWKGGFTRRNGTTRQDWAKIVGSVIGLAAFLVLGLYPVFTGWESEQEAADMAHNDVYTRTSLTNVCGAASWQGDNTGLGQWCTSLRTGSETLLVRSYASTFEGRYAALAKVSTALGAVLWMAYVLAKVLFKD